MKELFHIISEMSPYLLLGFGFAGLIHVFVPQKTFTTYISGKNFISVLYATLFGIPLPLCSCGVIPTAMSLRREGASKGATTAFLVATPQTGVDSIIATFSLMGLPFALIRPIAALTTALFSGQMVNWFDSDKEGEINIKQCKAVKEICEESHCNNLDNNNIKFTEKFLNALKYGYIEMMGDIGKWLVIGLVVAGMITVFIPDDFFQIFADNSILSMLLVLCMAIPMYLCATGSIPIAVALMLKGLTPGAGLVLLMAGPASNVASIFIIRKVLGNKALIIYLITIIIGAISFGLFIDYMLPREWFTSQLVLVKDCCSESDSYFSWICTGIMTALLVNALCIKPHSHKNRQNTIMENELIFTIEGMNCNHCRMNAEKALQSVKGVESASVDLPSKQARVTGSASFEDLSKAIEEIGFQAIK